jgi:hypothetical protein
MLSIGTFSRFLAELPCEVGVIEGLERARDILASCVVNLHKMSVLPC